MASKNELEFKELNKYELVTVQEIETDTLTMNEQEIDNSTRFSQNDIGKLNDNDEEALDDRAKQLTEETLAVAVKRLENINQNEPLDIEDPPNKTSVTEEITQCNRKEIIGFVEDPYEKATKFLEKHQLLMLFQTLTSDIVLKRPPDPLDFMIEEIEKIQEQDRHRKGVFLKVNKQTGSAKNIEDKIKDS